MAETSNRTNIIIAVIALLGSLGGALFANWDKIFPRTSGGTQNVRTSEPQVPKDTDKAAKPGSSGTKQKNTHADTPPDPDKAVIGLWRFEIRSRLGGESGMMNLRPDHTIGAVKNNQTQDVGSWRFDPARTRLQFTMVKDGIACELLGHAGGQSVFEGRCNSPREGESTLRLSKDISGPDTGTETATHEPAKPAAGPARPPGQLAAIASPIGVWRLAGTTDGPPITFKGTIRLGGDGRVQARDPGGRQFDVGTWVAAPQNSPVRMIFTPELLGSNLSCQFYARQTTNGDAAYSGECRRPGRSEPEFKLQLTKYAAKRAP